MKSAMILVLIDYTTVPRRRWTRAELRWVLHHHDKLPPIVAAVIRQKIRIVPPLTKKLNHVRNLKHPTE